MSDLNLKSWLSVAEESDFSIHNIPFGIFSIENGSKKVATRLGDHVVDLSQLHELGLLNDLNFTQEDFKSHSLNRMMKKGKKNCSALRKKIIDIFSNQTDELNPDNVNDLKVIHDIEAVDLHLPLEIGDYTDFYSSIEHATNVGTMFRDPNNALLPNWRHLPVGYHGRASSIILSGEEIHRPKGQTRPNPEEPPVYGPCKRLDFELEMAFVTFDGKPLGSSISTGEADDYIFGMCLFNDWSARDIQTWEYVPLGPFLAKNFASSISPWIVTLDALEPFRTAGPVQEPAVLPYLEYTGEKNIDISLEVVLSTDTGLEQTICQSNYKYMYWNMNQQLAHQTVNGCNIRVGDMYASGTISGPTEDSYGSMLELCWKGTRPIKLEDGTERVFLNDNDTVIMKGHCSKNNMRVGFGEVSTKILPAIE